jgi:large conductance mechanosensitive channel
MLKGFRDFVMRGNVVDLAVAVVIGSAFGKIVDSLVKDVIMPPIGLALGRVDFSNLFIVLKEGAPGAPYSTVDAAAKAGAVTLNLGVFANTVISFLIIAAAIFTIVKIVERLKRQSVPPPAAPSEEIVLLREIRDALKNR